jgi:ribonucleoside-diphosphate reductase alpha chain
MSKVKTKLRKGMAIPRYFTQATTSAYEQFRYEYRTSVIRNPSGDVVFEMNNVEVPEAWSQVATDILAQKYFRKAGVPMPDGSLGAETSIRQVAHRMAHCWRVWGERYGYFASAEDAASFYEEMAYMILDQRAAPNSPQWFNTGLYEAYGITGGPQGHWYVSEETGELTKSSSAYERPQPHACFILSVNDDLVNEGGIMDLWVREARIFKYGSGTGTNFSNVRAEGEKLAGGGTSSGLMSFLKVGDRAAGAIKSGGTTRRAAKMVVLDIDHPEIENFINWKVGEERKVAALIAAGYPSDYEGEAYRTVSGQNSNNSVRIPNEFFKVLAEDGIWHTTGRSDGKVMRSYPARELWDAIAQAAWACADPGLQFHSTVNEWHTCPEDGAIRASNPCSEYMFLDNTACNLASINLRKFFNADTLQFDVVGFEHACRLWTAVLEISVLMAHYPSREIAELSYKFRTLGLGYANLGSMLMVAGIPYDSPKALAITGAITSIMNGVAYETSAEMASVKGAFAGYEKNKQHMLRVMRNHRAAAYDDDKAYENLSVHPMGISADYCPLYLLEAARKVWDRAVQMGEQYGYRNAQATVLAPTGTIGLIMDCDTTGIEPDFALVKFKKLSGGGYFKIVNQSVPPALKNLGYSETESEAIIHYMKGHATLKGAPHINNESLLALGFTTEDLQKVEAQLLSAFEIAFVFNKYTLGEATLQRLGIRPEVYNSMDFNLLNELGFSDAQIETANEYICGTMTVEGAPYLKREHYAVFDCANKCGKKGQRFIHAHAHIRMMGAAQSFISGAISKTINLPHEASWQEIEECHKMSWKVGIKAISIYRDGSKLSQPLSTKSSEKKEEKETKVEVAEPIVNVVQAGKSPREMNDKELLELISQRLKEDRSGVLQTSVRKLVNRRELPAKRRGFTQKGKVGGQTLFLRTGEYPEGTLGEIFIDMHKEGATLRSIMNCFAIAVSIGLQYGVPLEEYVDKFAFTRFEPAGPVEHPNIKFSTSLVDYIFRLLAYEYLGRKDLVQVPNPDEQMGLKTPSTIPFEEQVNRMLAPLGAGKDAMDTVPSLDFLDDIEPVAAAPQHSHSTSASGTTGTQQYLSNMMGDAPACNVCGHITVRNGTCYKCLNCGNSMGCS